MKDDAKLKYTQQSDGKIKAICPDCSAAWATTRASDKVRVKVEAEVEHQKRRCVEISGEWEIVLKQRDELAAALAEKDEALNDAEATMNRAYAHFDGTSLQNWATDLGRSAGKCGQALAFKPCPKVLAQFRIKILREAAVDCSLVHAGGVCCLGEAEMEAQANKETL